MSGSTPGSNLVVVRSRSNSRLSSRQPSRGGSAHSSRPGTAHGTTSDHFTNCHDLHHSLLNSDTNLTHSNHLKNDWQGYQESVNQVAKLIEPGPLLNDWQRSVIDPFNPNLESFEYSTYVVLRRRFKHAADVLRRNLRHGETEWTVDVIFSGYVPCLESLIWNLGLEVSDVHDSTEDSHFPDSDTSSWFRYANSHFIIEEAKGLESAAQSVDLRSKLKSAFDRACAQAPSERHLYESLYDRMKQLWHSNTATRAQQQLAVNILEHSISVLDGVIMRQQITRELLYLWVPETEIVCEALGLAYTPTASPSPSPSMHSSHSLARGGTVLSHRKKLLYFS